MISESEIIECEYVGCGKIFSSTANLRRHVETCHRGMKPFECEICFKNFSFRKNKKEHIRLNHVYSFDNQHESLKSGIVFEDAIQVPKLTKLVLNSFDPDFRPFSKVERFYLFSDMLERNTVPNVSEDRQKEYESINLEGFKELCHRKRSFF